MSFSFFANLFRVHTDVVATFDQRLYWEKELALVLELQVGGLFVQVLISLGVLAMGLISRAERNLKEK